MKRKIFSVLLALTLIVSSLVCVPAKVKAAQATQIYVDGVALYDSMEHMWRTVGNGWAYNEKTNTLLLHGNFNYQYTGGSYNRILCCVRVEGDINIIVDGPTLINLGNNGLIGISVSGNCNLTLKNKLTINGGAGIMVDGNLVVKGEGSGKYVSKPSGHLYGGICAANITMKNVKGVNINTPTLFGIHTTGGNINIQSCKMNITAYTGAITAFYGNVKITGKNDITAKANAKGAPAIGVVTKNETNYIGCPTGSGKGKITLAKKVKVTSPKGLKKKAKSVKKTFPIVKGSTSKITFKFSSLSNGKVISKIRIK